MTLDDFRIPVKGFYPVDWYADLLGNVTQHKGPFRRDWNTGMKLMCCACKGMAIEVFLADTLVRPRCTAVELPELPGEYAKS